MSVRTHSLIRATGFFNLNRSGTTSLRGPIYVAQKLTPCFLESSIGLIGPIIPFSLVFPIMTETLYCPPLIHMPCIEAAWIEPILDPR